MPRLSLRLAGATLLLLASTASAGPLIIRATGPSAAQFKPGTRLGEAAVPLKKGDLVVVLDARGTRRFTGPGLLDAKAASKPAEDRIDFSDIAQPDGTRAVIAATRQLTLSAPAAVPAFDALADERLWTLPVAAGGRHCLLSGRPLTFVRTNATRLATLIVRRGDGRPLKLTFAAGQQSWTAPAGFFVGGGRYRLTLAGRNQQLTITPLPLPTGADAAATLDTIAQGLAAAGCQRQFALLADRIAPARP